MKRHIISFALLGALAAGVTGAAFRPGPRRRQPPRQRLGRRTGRRLHGLRRELRRRHPGRDRRDQQRAPPPLRQTASETGVSTAAAGAASFQNRLNCTNVPQRSCIASGNFVRMGGGAWTRK
jgi:hypothetical protein